MNTERLLTRLLLISVILALPLYAVRFSIGGLPTSVLEIVTLLGFLFALGRGKIRLGTLRPLELVGVGLVVLGSLIGAVVAQDSHAIGILKSWILTPILLYLWLRAEWSVSENRKQVTEWLPGAAAVTVVWVSGFALLQLAWRQLPILMEVLNPDVQHYLLETPLRVLAHFESPNYLAMFLLPLIGIVVWGAVQAKSAARVWLIMAAVLGVCAVYATRSQGAYLALLVGVALAVAPNITRTIPTKLRIWIVGTVAVIGTAAVLIAVYAPRQGSGEIRKEIYSYAGQLMQEHPVLGIGLGHFQQEVAVISAENISFQAYALPYALHAHSLYFTALLELGLIGFLGLLTLIVYGIYKMRKSPLLLASFAVILVHGLVDTTFFKADLASLFWLVLALGVSLADSKK